MLNVSGAPTPLKRTSQGAHSSQTSNVVHAFRSVRASEKYV